MFCQGVEGCNEGVNGFALPLLSLIKFSSLKYDIALLYKVVFKLLFHCAVFLFYRLLIGPRT